MNEKKQRPVKVWFDGGCRPNPGAMEYAVVLRGVTEIGRDLGHGTSDQAEWLALLAALEIAVKHGERDIILIGDSLSVIRQARGEEPCHSEMTRGLRERFREQVRIFDRVRMRHAGRSHNLAGTALERARWASVET